MTARNGRLTSLEPQETRCLLQNWTVPTEIGKFKTFLSPAADLPPPQIIHAHILLFEIRSQQGDENASKIRSVDAKARSDRLLTG